MNNFINKMLFQWVVKIFPYRTTKEKLYSSSTWLEIVEMQGNVNLSKECTANTRIKDLKS